MNACAHAFSTKDYLCWRKSTLPLAFKVVAQENFIIT